MVQIHVQPTLIILHHDPGNLKRGISPNNAKHHIYEASILVNTLIVQIILITSEQRPEDFCFEIIGMGLSK